MERDAGDIFLQDHLVYDGLLFGGTMRYATQRIKLTPKKKEEILDRDARRCIYCGEEATVIDHIIPWDWAHDNSDNNLVAACQNCNHMAGDKIFDSLATKAAYLDERRKHKRHHYHEFEPCICMDCGKLFPPRFNGSSAFLCADC